MISELKWEETAIIDEALKLLHVYATVLEQREIIERAKINWCNEKLRYVIFVK